VAIFGFREEDLLNCVHAFNKFFGVAVVRKIHVDKEITANFRAGARYRHRSKMID